MQQPECGGSEESGESLAVDVRSVRGWGEWDGGKVGGRDLYIYSQ